MRILYSPQRNDNLIEYTFDGEVITVNMGENTDTFDFSTMPDGEIARNGNGSIAIESTLQIMPVLDAKRVNGVLEVTLLRFHGKDASYEKRFPQPLEVV